MATSKLTFNKEAVKEKDAIASITEMMKTLNEEQNKVCQKLNGEMDKLAKLGCPVETKEDKTAVEAGLKIILDAMYGCTMPLKDLKRLLETAEAKVSTGNDIITQARVEFTGQIDSALETIGEICKIPSEYLGSYRLEPLRLVEKYGNKLEAECAKFMSLSQQMVFHELRRKLDSFHKECALLHLYWQRNSDTICSLKDDTERMY